MKRVIFMLVMLFTVSVYSFAEDNNANELETIEKYDLKINFVKLADYLQLGSDQIESVQVITNEFSRDMMFAAVECKGANRKAVTKNAVDKNMKYMYYVLNPSQYHKYLAVLNATINNRKIDIED